jgi:hypothetical protein
MAATDTSNDLTNEEIDALLATTKSKGQYTEVLNSFVESGARGRKIPLDSGRFSGKAPASVKTGFLTAVSKAGQSDQVRVIAPKDAGYVVLVNTSVTE